MIRVAALTQGRRSPSARARVRQHIACLRDLGVGVDEYAPVIEKHARLPGWPQGIRHSYVAPLYLLWQAAKLCTRLPGVAGSWTHQVTWLQREILTGVPALESWLRKPLVFDVDDAVWLHPPWGELALRRIAQRADVVVAGNRYLADWFSNHCRDVRVVPTAVDAERLCPAPAPEQDHRFTVGWTGLASNLPLLGMIEKPLARFLRQHREARLLVMANRAPVFVSIDPQQICYRPWSEDTEVRALQAMDVGVMPLPNDPWTRGKCSYKMLQYMACGIPVVVSPVGMNADVLGLGEIGLAAEHEVEWYDALQLLYRNRDQGRELGRQGRKVVREHFDLPLVARQLATVFKELVGD